MKTISSLQDSLTGADFDMRHRSNFHSRFRIESDPDLDSAINAMTADELRSFLRDFLYRVDDELRGEQENLLL